MAGFRLNAVTAMAIAVAGAGAGAAVTHDVEHPSEPKLGWDTPVIFQPANPSWLRGVASQPEAHRAMR